MSTCGRHTLPKNNQRPRQNGGADAFKEVNSLDLDDLLPGDAVSAAEYARRNHLDRAVVNTWRTRGYLNQDGERVYVEPRGEIKVGKRTYPVYLWTDLAAAERATRYRAKTRRDPILAADQRRHRTEAA